MEHEAAPPDDASQPPGWRDLVVPGPDRSALDRFAHVVATRPDVVAVASGGRELTFAALDAGATAVARRLLATEALTGAAPSTDPAPVGVLAEDGAGVVTALVAAWHAHRPVVLLDPQLPPDRLRQLVEQAGAPLVLVDDPTSASLRSLPVPVLAIDPDDVPGEPEPLDVAGLPRSVGDPGDPGDTDPASIVFTSGSTGTPKGVVLTHRTVLAGAAISREGLGIGPGDRVALVLPPAFAAGQEVVFMSLLNGASLRAYDPRSAGLRGLVPWLLEQRVTTLHCTPSLLRSLLGALAPGQQLPDVRLVTTCGEPVHGRDVEALREHLGPRADFVSWMGASEVGQLAFHHVRGGTPVPRGVIPVGPAVPLKEIGVLDEDGRPVPAGTTGDVHVTSAHLSGGYWREPERTAERFTALPDGRVRYRLGDRGWLDDAGVLNLVGRADHAVKVRGYLVEPAEVEAALLALPAVRQAVVRARRVPGAAAAAAGGTVTVDGDSPATSGVATGSTDPAADPGDGHDDDVGVRQLVAWVVPDLRHRNPSAAALRRALRAELPEWMVPTSVVLVPELPLTERGKLDSERLPDPPPRPRPAPARTEWEAVVGRTWSDVLGLDGVDPQESFSELGGDSLAAEEALERLREQLHVDVAAADLAEHPTLGDFAAHVAELTGGSRRARRSKNHVRLRASGDGVPVFCFAGAACEAGVFAGLAAELGPDHPVHAFEINGYTSRGRLDWSVRANARRHLRAIEELAPEGPVVLVGYSLGGLFALEAARLLAARGREVPLVVLLDTFLPASAGGHVGAWARRRDGSVIERPDAAPEVTAHQRRSRLALLLRTLRRQNAATLRKRVLLLGAGWVRYDRATQQDVFWQHGLFITRLARPAPWGGWTVVCRTDQNPDDEADWKPLLTGPHEVHRVPGDHVSMLQPPYLPSTAAVVRDALARLDAGGGGAMAAVRDVRDVVGEADLGGAPQHRR